MITFKDKPALLQESPITGWSGIQPRRARERTLKARVDLTFDEESTEVVNRLVDAFQDLFREDRVIGPDGKPMKLGKFGKLEAGPPLLFGRTESWEKEVAGETISDQTKKRSDEILTRFMEIDPSIQEGECTSTMYPMRSTEMANHSHPKDPFADIKEREEADDEPGFLRYWGFKFFGALFMRDKGTNGKPNMAISNHKTIGMVLFVAAMSIWLFGGTWLDEEQTMKLLEAGKELPSKWGLPPDALIYSFWAALGLKGALDVAGKFRK